MERVRRAREFADRIRDEHAVTLPLSKQNPLLPADQVECVALAVAMTRPLLVSNYLPFGLTD